MCLNNSCRNSVVGQFDFHRAPIFEIPVRSRIASIPYMPQLMATEIRVVMIPRRVVLQPTVSITQEGHTMYRRSVSLPMLNTPLTP